MYIYYSNQVFTGETPWYVADFTGEQAHSCRHNMGGGPGAEYFRIVDAPSGCLIDFFNVNTETSALINQAKLRITQYSTTTGSMDYTTLLASPHYEVAPGVKKYEEYRSESSRYFTHIRVTWPSQYTSASKESGLHCLSAASTMYDPPAPLSFDELALYPNALSRVSNNDQAQFLVDPQIVPAATRLWACTAGHINEQGLYTANAQSSGRSTVSCTLMLNDVSFIEACATLSHAETASAPPAHWTYISAPRLEVTGFGGLRPVRAFMYGNGAQQLVVDINLEPDNGALLDEEWANLRFFDYHSHQEILALPPGEAPILRTRKWASTSQRNDDFYPATDENSNESEINTSTLSRYFYLHSLAPWATTKKIYVGLCDTLGWWHYFTQSKNTFEVAIRPFHAPSLTLHSVQRGGFDDNSNEIYPYETNFDTYEYFALTSSPAVPFSACTVHGKNESGQWVNRNSIVRFERDAPIESHCSVTGVTLGPQQTEVMFDSQLKAMTLFNSKLYHPIDFDIKDHQVIISVHRFSDTPLMNTTSTERNLLLNNYSSDLRFTFYDKFGNSFSKIIGFIPNTQARHRNQIT